MKELEWSQGFPHYNPMGVIYCHRNQSSDPIWPKALCSQSPTPMMLQMKFDYDRPAGLRDIHVWKCGRTPARVPHYKLTLSLGSGELIINSIKHEHSCKILFVYITLPIARSRLCLCSSNARWQLFPGVMQTHVMKVVFNSMLRHFDLKHLHEKKIWELT